jgi:hypothetical protein
MKPCLGSSVGMGPRTLRSVPIAVVLMFVLGCESTKKPILPAKTDQSNQEQNASAEPSVKIVHPEYANWSQFPVGAQVTRYRVVSNKNGEVKVTTVLSLQEKTDEHVIVNTQVNVQRPGEKLEENPPESTKFVSKFLLPSGLSEDYFSLPSVKAKKVGEESLDLHGKTILADIYEWTESNETGPMSIKLWRSNQVPGRIVRQEMLIEASQTKTLEELSSVGWDGKPSQ